MLVSYWLLQSAAAFEWGQGLLVLAVTAVVLGGLTLVEAAHLPGRRRSQTRATAAPARPTPPINPPASPQVMASAAASAPWSERVQWRRAVFAGVVATAVMSAFFAILAAMGWPRLDPAGSLAAWMANNLFLGWIAHFLIGVVLAVIYALWFMNALSGGLWLRGAVFALLPFLAAQMVAMPLMGGGFFSSAMPRAGELVFLNLLGYLIFGVVLGWIYHGSAEGSGES